MASAAGTDTGIFKHVQFRFEWRPYQQRVLGRFEQHASDLHHHVIAPPGSGKTVLGLEIVRRTGVPPLILAPSIAIREQWVERFRELFEGSEEVVADVSRDLRQPRQFNINTYQGVFAAVGELGVEAVCQRLSSAGVRMLVFDEAHHLRKEWWKVLFALKKKLGEPHILALTATPPQDVPQVEWNRYIKLCGPVDEEISIPELVAEKNLCPHQDYVYFSGLPEDVLQKIRHYEHGVQAFISDLSIDESFISRLQAHPLLQETDAPCELDVFLNQSEFFLALQVFLFHATGLRDPALDERYEMQDVDLPRFDSHWAEILMNGLLFSKEQSISQVASDFRQWQDRLQKLGCLERKKVQFSMHEQFVRWVRASSSKLGSVADLVVAESEGMGAQLRMVVLSDHVRKEDFPKPGMVEKVLHRLGVVPAFERIRQLQLPMVQPGILTGTCVVIPSESKQFLEEWFSSRSIDPESLTFTGLEHAPEYLEVAIAEKYQHELTQGVGVLLEEGNINVLVGTVAYLGQGWDAPAVNTLVLASAVGSYIGINQLRGRALRIQPGRPDKVSNIWHLACLTDYDSRVAREHTDESGSSDWQLLKRRFDSFPGVDEREKEIVSGWERLNVSTESVVAQRVELLNREMIQRSSDRYRVVQNWQDALESNGSNSDEGSLQQRLMTEILFPAPVLRTHPVFRHFERWSFGFTDWYRQWRLERRVRQMADALLLAMVESELMDTPQEQLSTLTTLGQAHARAALIGGSQRDADAYVEVFAQLFNPMRPIRYLMLGRDTTYAVPGVLSRTRERAERMSRHWNRQVEKVELLSLRQESGKQSLLKWKQLHMIQDVTGEVSTERRWLS